MNTMLKVLLCLIPFGTLAGMEKAQRPASIVFENRKREQVLIPSEIVAKSRLLNNEYQRHQLGTSIGTNGHVSLESPTLQNIELLQKCVDYSSRTPEQLDEDLAAYARIDTIGNLVKTMEMSAVLNLPQVSGAIAQAIANVVTPSSNRAEVFKNGVLNRLQSDDKTLNLISQKMLARSGTKYYWFTKVREKNEGQLWGIEEKLNNYLAPAQALVLLDSYEHKELGKPLSFAPGMEQIVPRDLKDLVKPSFGTALSYKWSGINPKYKCAMAGLGAATLAAAGYGLYNWCISK